MPHSRPALPAARVPLLAAAAFLAAAVGPAAAATPRELRRNEIVEAVEKVAPAVVNISTETRVENPFADFVDPFEWFFGGGQRRPRQRIENSLGSGVVVSADGYVLTNDHVISQASKITVTLRDGRQIEADLVGSDRDSDLAVLKLKDKGPFPFAKMGDSDDLMIGETAIAIGNPFGLENTVTVGVLSAVGRSLPGPDRQAVRYADFIQTDAAINPGNSGGALVNILGELIGINAQIVASGQNLGFAIPIARGRKVYDELKSFGRVRPLWTGMVLGAADEAELGGPNGGVVVWRVFGDSPAAAAGIQAADVILEVNGQKTASVPEFDTALARVGIGGTASVRLRRDGETLTRSFRPTAFTRELGVRVSQLVLGFTVVEGKNGTVVVDQVRADSEAGQRGLAKGMAVLQVNGRPVETSADFYDEMPASLYRRAVNLVIATRSGRYRLTLPTRR
ncbi:MAG: trypsin-like peptidase domain-containing protein [Acidobacteria bacterium]|jgi:serine protease Do|nr:trypsin-like peptidase domain-containing protein [Acidobacteriota bacterium]MCU0253123.1 trypsin-like peptidase domain-containing protein [Acidobacteriota bacterium]